MRAPNVAAPPGAFVPGVFGLLALLACDVVDVPRLIVAPEQAVAALPARIPEPADNPSTPSKVELGRLLFWDPILSGERDVACATCHHPAHAYADGRDLSVGVGGTGLGPARRSGPLSRPVNRNSMTILDVAWNGVGVASPEISPAEAPMFWDSRDRSLETQALKPIESAEEMRGERFTKEEIFPELERRLSAIPEYASRFEAVFGRGAITRVNIGRALAAYERTLVARGSSFDRYMAGDDGALSQAAKRGLVALVESGCTRCHSGPMFSDFKLHRLGLPPLPGHTSDVGDGTGRFRTPSLRNVTSTGPFMHDGRFQTLRQLFEFYTGIDKSLDPDLADLAPAGLDDITALFEALSDGDFDRTVPAVVPSGLPPGGHLDRSNVAVPNATTRSAGRR
ncbi:MAG TPA: cytochrome c peroxidase [Polyangia bacterium]